MGIYNPDLAENMVLIELGKIENTEEEINRTISVLSKNNFTGQKKCNEVQVGNSPNCTSHSLFSW
ncbi:stage II sporulation protein P [Solibacillus isronensis]|uniref:stage II sporulation protein P n=1 Tax=Solibacillus isronensis TaxID=412383 RepID=UPI0009A68B09|nr:stage II sporulation protein P [Solibacillus isronensis]